MREQLEDFLPFLPFQPFCLELPFVFLWKRQHKVFMSAYAIFPPLLQELVMITCFPVDRAIPSPLQSILKKKADRDN